MHTSYYLTCESVVLLFLISKLYPAFMNHLMCNNSSSPNINFQAFLTFLASVLYENYYCFFEEGRHNKYHLEGSVGGYYYQKPKEYVEFK